LVYEKLIEGSPGLLALLDPDRIDRERLDWAVDQASANGACGILVGTSILFSPDLDKFLSQVKERSQVPVIIFPGGAYQVSPNADAIFFLTLVSGRNPELLIGEQVRAAPLIHRYGLEVIPVGYILLESGSITAVEFMSGTRPIPKDKPELVLAHALAAQYLGVKFIYLEAGSGAKSAVSPELVELVRSQLEIPLIVGGGIRSGEEAKKLVKAGADLLVMGNALEADYSRIAQFVSAIRTQ
jgi:phosphoglycerol geranylgeranyltransferase